ncbi:complement resistance protein TraT [Serratia marcescens]|uniref:complement resistance protein TraT n=1 Tax=Serratia marcescens TaxID=615 RepID=UPI00215DAB3F|nr:complement resistance protein TraT [Serratia marcescens]
MAFKKISDLYYQCENGSRNVAVLLFHSRRLMCLIRKNGVLVPCRSPCSVSTLNRPAKYPHVCLPRSGAAIATFPVPVSGPFLSTARLFIQAAFIASNQERKMHCPNCGSQNIRLRHVGKKTGGVIGATAGGLAGLEGASAGALIGSVIPAIGTIAGGLIGFLSGACAGAVAGSLAGEQLDGTVFDEYSCTQCEHIFSAP